MGLFNFPNIFLYKKYIRFSFIVTISQPRDSRVQQGIGKVGNDSNSISTIGNNLIRSHSHSNVNKPSQDLLGLTLHEISDPIDATNTCLLYTSDAADE